MTLGELIRHRRKELALTQAELGKRIGWPDSRIGAYERDESVPSETSIRKLAAALELPPYEFGLSPMPDVQVSSSWFAQVRWCAEDVIAAAERNGITLTEAQAEKWLEKNERWFRETLTEYGNEVLASASKESFEEVCKA